jgi:type I restriction enzyme R subunit
MVVTTRPREPTRKQLRELKIVLDGAGYGELALRAAWRPCRSACCKSPVSSRSQAIVTG